MSFCRECGKPLEDGVLFCGECGTPVNDKEEKQVSQRETMETFTEKHPLAQKNERQPLSKKTQIMLVAGVVTVILLFGLHKFLENVFSPIRLIENFEEAVLEENAAKLAELLHTTDKKMEITEDSVKGIMEIFKRHPEQLNIVMDHLRAELKEKDQSAIASEFEWFEVETDSNLNLIYIEPIGKFLFYERYQLMVPTVYLSIDSNYANVEISVDGEKQGTITDLESEFTFGPYLPGYHKVSGTLKTDFFELKEEKEVYLDYSMTKENVDLYFAADKVEFVLPVYEADYTAQLFVNRTDVNVNLVEETEFGPVLVDGSMTYFVEAQLPWGTVKTEEAPIDDYVLEVDLITDELVQTLMETAHTFNMEMAETLTTASADHMTTATSTLKENLVTEANDDKEYGRARQVSYLSSEFDKDSVHLYYDEYLNAWFASIYGYSYWQEDYIYDPDDEFELEEEDYVYKYFFVYDEAANKWLVSDLDYNFWYSSDGEHVEFVLEKPETYTSVWIDELGSDD